MDSRRLECQKELTTLSTQFGMTSLGDDAGNTALQRSASIAGLVTAAETRLIELRARRDVVATALKSPDRLSDYVQSLQSRGPESGDSSFEHIRRQLTEQELSLASQMAALGSQNGRVLSLQSSIELLKQRLHEMEAALARSSLRSISGEVESTEQTLIDLNAMREKQKQLAESLAPATARYNQLKAELARIERQTEQMERRSTEIRCCTP